MFRPTLPDDTPTLVAQATATGMFKSYEIEALQEVLDDYHAVNHIHGHVGRTLMDAGAIVGFAYFAPAAMTDRTWELWWIVVDPSRQGQGLGSKMLAEIEREVKSLGGRILLIDTSSQPLYVQTRQFYLKHAYSLAAQVPDFYADGDDKVIFAKRLATAPH